MKKKLFCCFLALKPENPGIQVNKIADKTGKRNSYFQAVGMVLLLTADLTRPLEDGRTCRAKVI